MSSKNKSNNFKKDPKMITNQQMHDKVTLILEIDFSYQELENYIVDIQEKDLNLEADIVDFFDDCERMIKSDNFLDNEDAFAYLQEHDEDLCLSLRLACERGYTARKINVRTLASVLKQSFLLDKLAELQSDTEAFLKFEDYETTEA